MSPTRTSERRELVSGGSRGGRSSCPDCGRRTVTVVGLQLGDGSGVEMHACGSCETQSWWQDGQQVDRGEVLETLRRTGGPRSRRRRSSQLP